MQRQNRIQTAPSAAEPNPAPHRTGATTRRITLPALRLPRRGCVVIVVVALTAACDGRGSSTRSPTAPTPGSSAATYTVSGTVSESTSSGLTPVSGVVVRDGNSGRWAMTDGGGFYAISGVPASSTELTTQRLDYVSTRTRVSVSEDLRVDLLIRPIAAQTLSGVVFEMSESGEVGVEGVSIYCDACGSPVGHTFATTDNAGRYSFSWADNGATQLIVRKEGYWVLGPSGSPELEGRIVALVEGDTRFDIELVRR